VYGFAQESNDHVLLYFYSRNLGKSGLRVSCLGLGKYLGCLVGVAVRWETGEAPGNDYSTGWGVVSGEKVTSWPALPHI
jgi:hypothetical protein